MHIIAKNISFSAASQHVTISGKGLFFSGVHVTTLEGVVELQFLSLSKWFVKTILLESTHFMELDFIWMLSMLFLNDKII